MAVGQNLKSPRHPIWIVNSESHFTVIFGLDPGLAGMTLAATKSFELFYYDGLARQEECIRLTLDVSSDEPVVVDTDKEAVPPLELCLRTKWPSAVVDWNGAERIL